MLRARIAHDTRTAPNRVAFQTGMTGVEIAGVILGAIGTAGSQIAGILVKSDVLRRAKKDADDRQSEAGKLYGRGQDSLGPTDPKLSAGKSSEIVAKEHGIGYSTLDREKAEQQAKAWDLWLDCQSQTEIADAVGISQPEISRLIQERKSADLNIAAPDSRQHFDVWNFQTAGEDAGTGSYFGKMPSQG